MDNPYRTPEEELLEEGLLEKELAEQETPETALAEYIPVTEQPQPTDVEQELIVLSAPESDSDNSKKQKRKKYPPLTPEENNKANMLCVISLACQLLPLLANDYIVRLIKQLQQVSVTQYASATSLGSISSSILTLATIAGFVLMVYVRIKYPQNTFGKILMVLYITLIVIMLIVFAIVLVTCSVICGGILTGAGSSCG